MASRRSSKPELPKRVEKLIEKWAKTYGIDPNIAKAQAWQESRGDQKAKSRVGALGVMQLMPKTAKELKVDPNNTEDNIKGGMKYLARQLKAFKGNYSLALAAYNAGPGNVRKHGGQVPPFKETQNYVKNILRNSARIAARPGPAPRSTAPRGGRRAGASGTRTSGGRATAGGRPAAGGRAAGGTGARATGGRATPGGRSPGGRAAGGGRATGAGGRAAGGGGRATGGRAGGGRSGGRGRR